MADQGEASWANYYKNLLSSLEGPILSGEEKNTYVTMLGALQACCDFNKPASMDEEKLLKSILSMDIRLTDSEADSLSNLQKEFEDRRHKIISATKMSQQNNSAETVELQKKKIESQARHITVLMEQNRILLEAAKYHQQKATLVMAMHSKNGIEKRNLVHNSKGKYSQSNNSTPSLAPSSQTRTPSPGEFREFRISRPSVTAIPRLPNARQAIESKMKDTSATSERIIREQSTRSTTVLSELMSSNAALFPKNSSPVLKQQANNGTGKAKV
mmetsp:Transcript_8915/g.13316  ORF Transcript_8915/g.13316 Transcript_8915/m.13316 type:complete len:272 (+) Transcript_8915:3-818(+)